MSYVLGDDGATMACGLNTLWWSRAYQPAAIPQVLCKKCKKVTG